MAVATGADASTRSVSADALGAGAAGRATQPRGRSGPSSGISWSPSTRSSQASRSQGGIAQKSCAKLRRVVLRALDSRANACDVFAKVPHARMTSFARGASASAR